ncbi:hypothetical protein ABK905_05920 [Acerihabitans sp. KWT182]|uniref:Uncharacterized protein n=1 Tax=Acerihabitans sp. KWT182 TaxID=3157919 RepID=A0AAU7QCD3_9GAMM
MLTPLRKTASLPDLTDISTRLQEHPYADMLARIQHIGPVSMSVSLDNVHKPEFVERTEKNEKTFCTLITY